MMGKIGGNQMTNDDKDLKPCYHCKQYDELEVIDCSLDDPSYAVHCKRCNLYLHADTAKDAVNSWNTRATPQQTIDGNTSDGYHTFNELYDHRCLLWINYCLTNPEKVYLVENHFDGWFLLGKETTYGQISYHCPNKFFNLVEKFERRHPEFDGHTSNDVINRLVDMAKPQQPNDDKVEDYETIRKLLQPIPLAFRDVNHVSEYLDAAANVLLQNGFHRTNSSDKVWNKNKVIDSLLKRNEELVTALEQAPQQPSEPLKELDDFQEINFNNYNEDDVRALQYWAFKAYEIIKSKFVQPSEKKALSVKSIKKEILKQWNEYDRMNVQMDSHEEAERLAQAIHSAMPAQREVRYPEKINHKASCQCFYDKEMPCSCGADERNQTIDEFKKLNS